MAEIRHDYPHDVEETENVWIPLADGVQLAARIWKPADASEAPVPAILEYLPYRKRDFMRSRDEAIHRYFAGHGYAAVRVDIRGSGDSDGILTDEYTDQELTDAEEVIAWLAAQPWCSGAVGMTGISWGGFNALQVAARRPPALRAVISLCSTDDRYADDAHYMGGCLLNGEPPVGRHLHGPEPGAIRRIRRSWGRTAGGNHVRTRGWIICRTCFRSLWLQHPWRDDYWKRGLCLATTSPRIEIPVYAIGGWADGYSNAVPRLVAESDVRPARG